MGKNKIKYLLINSFCCVFFLFYSASAFADILVVSPHPDDDIIMASGVIFKALERGEQVRVVYMTNGDYAGLERGAIREAEAVNAQEKLGMAEDNLVFLGYPDGHLTELFTDYTSADDVYTSPIGQSETYANRGLGRTDYHSYIHGAAAPYNKPNMVSDLQTLIESYYPEHIFIPSEFDSGDHVATYHTLQVALQAVFAHDAFYNPTVHKTTVWCATDTAWPNDYDPTSYFREIVGLDRTGLVWAERESLDVPFPMQSLFYPGNWKQLAADEHVTQHGSWTFLGRFIHKDEIFWVEQHRGTNQAPVVNAGLDQNAAEGETVTLNGSGSFDDNDLIYSWRQVGGLEVALSSSVIANPVFTAPTGLIVDEILTFELSVSDGEFTSVPDAVNVRVISPVPPPTYTNVAPLAATLTASSVHFTSDLANLVDGCLSGYPADASCEWVAQGTTGNWVELTWDMPITIGRITMYDRPNTADQVKMARLTFNDGVSMEVGPLENLGRPVSYQIPPREITSLRLEITGVAYTTSSIGLAELEVYAVSGNVNHAPVANAGADQSVGEGVSVVLSGSSSYDLDGDALSYSWSQVSGPLVNLSDSSMASPAFISPTDLSSTANLVFQLSVSDGEYTSTDEVTVTVIAANPVNTAPVASAGATQTVDEGDLVVLDGGSSYDPDGDSLIYNWSQISGAAVVLSDATSSTPTFTAAMGLAADATLVFELVVSDGTLTSSVSSVSVTVVANLTNGINIAGDATARASSESSATQQTAVKAIDGCIDGYPGDYTCEWVAYYWAVKVGSWLELTWATPHIIDRIVLYDRPNSNDQITSATITLSDGSSFMVGPLNNDGSASEYVFPAVEVTSLRMTVVSVRGNVGLSEIEVFESVE